MQRAASSGGSGGIGRALAGGRADSLLSEGGPDYFTQSMSLLCPLDDDSLPMEAANLKSKQVGAARRPSRGLRAARGKLGGRGPGAPAGLESRVP
ncbi:hypothetical protein MNEG_15457 [Monoraphidium neglectum]|uniref:Uncharacterized protein n=1 Tax=Monoraphidium neglectum TaxID=145388 RepID=A0A0D2MAZ1_9CHLO|nr:hypothetical protein MNEG_15457 [Monoraphidium neglectum]KIY92505.1 hypothetical protein MNEG_15457 [Monoraphidium neglectum]|eukprot:XP_013891525.1 hypothetical protein MNEG_15457 [Monoraphidium neglectum]